MSEATIHTTLDYLLDEITWKAALPGDNSQKIAEYRAQIHDAVRAVAAGAGDPQEPSQFEDAVVLEYPSGNWAGYLDAALATDLVPYWNAHADENQVLCAVPISSGLGPNQQERRPRAGDRPPAPSEAAIVAFLAEYSRIAAASRMGCSHIDGQVTSALQAAYGVDFGAVRPTPRAAPTLQRFVAFVGEGHVEFPRNLSELADAVALFECAEEDAPDVPR